MKKIACLLLSLCLLLSVSALAEEETEGFEAYESPVGFTVRYDPSRIMAYSVPSGESGYDTDFFEPVADNTGAYLFSTLADSPDSPDWEGMGYQRVSMDEPDIELDERMDAAFRRFLSPDGKQTLDEIRLDLPGEMGECVFALIAPVSDPDGWRNELIRVLETVEFPAQEAEKGSFRLMFDQGGAAGMRFMDVLVDMEAEPIVLMPLDTVTGFSLEYLTWDDETFSVANARPIFTADPLSPGDNLRIHCYFTDMFPVLRVRCINSAGDAECWYIADSARDGSPLLLSEADVMY